MLWLRRFWPLLLGLLYLASPIDAIPDTLLGLGWSDDILLLLLAYWLFKRLRTVVYARPEPGSGNGSRREERTVDKDPFEILGVSPHATHEEIKSAYRKQAQRYHPDRVSHLGDEFQQLAKQKFQDIQNAYETLCRESRL